MDSPYPSSVHIVTCSDPSCVETYTRMCVDLEENGIGCVEEGRGDYGIGAYLFKDKFKEKIDSTLFTVIHLCPEMIEKLQPVEELLGESHYRSKFLYINTNKTPHDIPMVYKQASRLRLFSDTDYKNIVKRLSEAVVSSATSASSAKKLTYTTTSSEQTTFRADEDTVADTVRDYDDVDEVDNKDGATFVRSPGNSGDHERAVYYLASRIQHQNHSLLKYTCKQDLEEMCNRGELFAPNSRPNTVRWLLTHVLPQVTMARDISSMTVLLQIPVDQVKDRVYRVFWEVLLVTRVGEIAVETVKVAERIMFEEARNVKNTDEDAKITCIYFVTLIHKIVSLSENRIGFEKSFNRRLYSLRDDDMKYFLETFSNNADLFIRAVRPEDLKEFRIKQTWPFQFIKIFHTLMKVFHGDGRGKLEALESLPKLLKPKKMGTIKLKKTVTKPHRLVIKLLTMSISCFLHSVAEITGEDFHAQTVAAFKVLRQFPEVLRDQSLMKDLIFSSNDQIRSEAMSLLTAFEYSNSIPSFIELEVSGHLEPINIDLRERQDISGTAKSNWLLLPVGRLSERVMLHIHLPLEEDLSKQIKSNFMSHDEYRNTVEILRSLDTHHHILPLLAYRVDHVPVFFVTEDYSQPNLHRVLYFKAKHSHWLRPLDLLVLLLQALDAIIYIQKKGIVHRDITASSFLYSKEHNRVKLFRFQLARKCSRDQIIVDRDCSGIPTRWSAPESLSKCHFTFRSDCWMLGHLIYEVITHGALPYSDLGTKSESEIADLIKRGSKKLSHERCIPTKVFATIMDCTKLSDDDRLSACEIKCKLEETLEAYSGAELSERLSPLNLEAVFPQLDRISQSEPHRGLAGQFADKSVHPRTTSMLTIAQMDVDIDEGVLPPNTTELLKIKTIFSVTEEKTKLDIKEYQKRHFSPEEESFLLTQNLQGFFDHVTVVKYEDGEALSYSIPVECDGNLLTLAEERFLGDNPDGYIKCLRDVAQTLNSLHTKEWIHGCLSARNIWIKHSAFHTEVYLSELAYMRRSRDVGDGIVNDATADPPEEEEVFRRSAPEVIHNGIYSPACDVYSFGLVVWEVLAALSEEYFNELKTMQKEKLYEYLTTRHRNEILPQPSACPSEIYSLLRMCWGSERHERPDMAVVHQKLNEYISKLSGGYLEVSEDVIYDSIDSDDYEEPQSVPRSLKSSIDNDGPDGTLTTIFPDESETYTEPLHMPLAPAPPRKPHLDILKNLGNDQTGRQMQMDKFLSHSSLETQNENASGLPVYQNCDQHVTLAKQLPNVGSPSANVQSLAEFQTRQSTASIETTSDINHLKVLTRKTVETEGTRAKKTPPPLPPKPRVASARTQKSTTKIVTERSESSHSEESGQTLVSQPSVKDTSTSVLSDRSDVLVRPKPPPVSDRSDYKLSPGIPAADDRKRDTSSGSKTVSNNPSKFLTPHTDGTVSTSGSSLSGDKRHKLNRKSPSSSDVSHAVSSILSSQESISSTTSDEPPPVPYRKPPYRDNHTSKKQI